MDDNKFIYESGDLKNSTNQLDQEYSELGSSNNFNYTEEQPVQNNEEQRKKWFIIAIIFFVILLLSTIVAFVYSNNKKYDNWLQKIIEAARAHVNSDEMVQSEIMLGNLDKITLDTLINDGHLANVDLINPRTKKSISMCNYVMLSVNNDTISYTRVTIDVRCQTGDDNNNKPTIMLLGEAIIYIAKGETYTDPGAKATDVDGSDISESITVKNDVDVNVPAEYQVTYSVTNNKGKEADPVVRYVIVEDKKIPDKKDPIANPKPKVTTVTKIIYVDKTEPTISLHGIAGGNVKVAPNTKVTFMLNYADNVRLKKIVWCINSSCSSQSISVKTYGKTVTYIPKTAGVYQIKASAVDSSGNTKALTNMGTITATDVTTIDKINPTVSVSGVPSKTISIGDEFNYAFTFADNVALKSIQYCVGQSDCNNPAVITSGTSKVITGKFTAAAEGIYYFRAGATDGAGNITEISTLASVKVGKPIVDFSAPTAKLVNAVADQVAPGTPIEAKVRIEDDVQLKSYSVCIGTVCKSGDIAALNAKWVEVPISATMSVVGNYDIVVNASDMTNKTLSNKILKTVRVVEIPKTIPNITVVSVSPSSPKPNDNVTVTVKINDDTGIAFYEVEVLDQIKREYLTNTKEKIITFNVKFTQAGTYNVYGAASSISGGEYRNKIIRNIVVADAPVTPPPSGDIIKTCKTYAGTASYCIEKPSSIKAGQPINIKITITDSLGIIYYNSSLSGVPTEVGSKVLSGVNANEAVINFNVTFDNANNAGYPLYLGISGNSGQLINTLVDNIQVG